MTIIETMSFSKSLHDGLYTGKIQTRFNGENYYENHVLKVYETFLRYSKDISFDSENKDELMKLCLLHDVLEDTGIQYQELEDLVGKQLALYVQELTYPENIKNNKLEYVKNKVLSPHFCYSSDVAFVKLCDIYCNTIDAIDTLRHNDKLNSNDINRFERQIRQYFQIVNYLALCNYDVKLEPDKSTMFTNLCFGIQRQINIYFNYKNLTSKE